VDATPRFLQTITTFSGVGLDDYNPLEPPLTYTVPPDAQTQCVYFRGGNSSDELICVVLVRDGRPMRLFPIGARQAIHVPLRVTEDLLSDTTIEVQLAAPPGSRGTVVIDVGLLEL
jgi:hypothetical protein